MPNQNPQSNQSNQNQNQNPQEQQATEQEAQQFMEEMQKTADQWRAKLADPVMQQQIKAGKLTVSPLVQELLNAFPPSAKK